MDELEFDSFTHYQMVDIEAYSVKEKEKTARVKALP